ncbi:hypothetical protein ACH5RR_008815 [Cinchona calisaya]|uniref:Uncharacterized protein n=1 Tax=Cinchona calisaya TaxID=153742 RepID=A0ABD3AEB6_9GENT
MKFVVQESYNQHLRSALSSINEIGPNTVSGPHLSISFTDDDQVLQVRYGGKRLEEQPKNPTQSTKPGASAPGEVESCPTTFG